MNKLIIELVKKAIFKLSGIRIKIKVSLGRNKYEYYEGSISKMYSNLLVVDTNKGKKTFSYSDIASKQVIISKFS